MGVQAHARAESRTEHPFGLEQQAWLREYALDRSERGGTLLAGRIIETELVPVIFDIMGNVYEWCHGSPKPNEKAAPRFQLVEDIEILTPVQGNGYQRGGSFDSRLNHMNCEYPNLHNLAGGSLPVGFRLARTCD